MTTNNIFLTALFISLTIHTVFVCGTYWMKMPEIKKAGNKRVEVSYRPMKIKTFDIKQHAIKPIQKLDLQNSILSSSNDTIGLKTVKESQSLKGLAMYERKPTQIQSAQANYVTVTPMPITSEKVNSPIYTAYQSRVRESIEEKVIENYSLLHRNSDRGRVYLTFIITSDGTLKDYQIIANKSEATSNLSYISTKSLKEVRFSPFIKGMTLPEYTFSITIEYKLKDE